MSRNSKYKQYQQGIERFLFIKKHFSETTIFHALGCGSRTMIAMLSSLSVRFFDSSAYYKAAFFGEAVEPITFCSIGKPNSKPKCKQCLIKQRTPHSDQTRINYNLRETFKEVQRCKCALAEKKMKDYLQLRLKPKHYELIVQYL